MKRKAELRQLPMIEWSKVGKMFEGSLYFERCPRCGAEPFCWCRTASGTRTTPHRERRGRGAPEKR